MRPTLPRSGSARSGARDRTLQIGQRVEADGRGIHRRLDRLAPAAAGLAALAFTGNLFTIGSMANLIVIEQARLHGVSISFREYARSGVLVTAMNLVVLAGWILLMGTAVH
mgnify:CR=1 FL=1